MSSYFTAEEFDAMMTEEVNPQSTATSPVTINAPKTARTASPMRPVEQSTQQKAAPVSVPTGVCAPRAPTFDPRAKPTTGLNLRLNDYQLELIRQLAAREDRSMQQVIRRTLIPAVELALHPKAE